MNPRIGLLLIAALVQTAPAQADVDGSVDPNYGLVFGRTVINTFPGLVDGTPGLSALANSNSGRTWLFGNADNPANRLLIARLNADSGLLDNSFGGGSGQLSTAFPAGVTSFLVSSAIIQADGKPIVAGNWGQNGEVRGYVCRLNVAGNLDVTYGSGGCRALRAFLYTNERCGVAAIAADPADSSLVVAGACNNADQAGVQRPYLARLTSTGNLDTEFGAGAGVTTPTVTNGNLRYISAIAIQPGGRFVAIGSNLRLTGDYDISALQFSNDGTLDPSFGSAGVVTITPDIAGGNDDFGGDIAVRPDGRILIVGLAEGVGLVGTILLQQLTATGGIDSSFGSNGRYLAPETLDHTFGMGGNYALVLVRPRVALDDLGRAVVLVLNGLPVNGDSANARVYRFTAAGGKDPNFGDAQRGVVDINNEVALSGSGGITDSPAGLVVSRSRILLGMTSRRTNSLESNMLTLTLQGGALFSNGFE